MTLRIKNVETLQQAMDIAGVRNEVRENMTHSRHLITYAEQVDWMENIYKPEHEAGNLHAFAGYIALQPAIYGLISKRQEQFWLTGAVRPSFQGKGYGRALFEFLTDYTVGRLEQPEVMLDVSDKNERAIALYESIGYMATKASNGIIIMKYGAPNAGQKE